MSKYSVGERETAAWNVQLDLQWGKTGLIVSCTLYTGGLPAANCCLHRSAKTELSKRPVSGGKGGAAVWHDRIWPFISGLLHLLPRKHCSLQLNLQPSSSTWHVLVPHLSSFCLGCCPSSLAGSKQILMGVLKPSFSWKVLLMLLSPPVFLFRQPCLAGSSLLWLSCGCSCRFWEDECAECVCCSSLVCVLLGLNAVLWHNWLLLIVLGFWDAGSAST